MSETTTPSTATTTRQHGTMQLLIRLRASQDCAFERAYHRKIRGRLAQCLTERQYEHYDGSNVSPLTFSDPMPYRPEYDEGDESHLLVAASDTDVLRSIATDLRDDPRLTAGSMVFDVRAATPIPADVGPPGETGTITTASGAVVTVERSDESEYPDGATYWTDRDYSTEDFRAGLSRQVAAIVEYKSDDLRSAAPIDDGEQGLDPFDDYHHHKTYAVDVEVTLKTHLTSIASKWDFGYEVRSDAHRRVLNTLLASGIGSKRSFGFGCLRAKSQSFDPTGDADRTSSEVHAHDE